MGMQLWADKAQTIYDKWKVLSSWIEQFRKETAPSLHKVQQVKWVQILRNNLVSCTRELKLINVNSKQQINNLSSTFVHL